MSGSNAVRYNLAIEQASIVALGNFNPAIFTPAWFELQGLMSGSNLEDANLGVAHAEVLQFDWDWLHIRSDKTRFQALTQVAPLIRVRDLVLRVFQGLLPHTPITAIGMNYSVHFQVRNYEEYNRIGRTLAPIDPWGEVGELLQLDRREGGMTSLTMSQLDSVGVTNGDRINIKIEPSNYINQTGSKQGIFVEVNNHFGMGEDDLSPLVRLDENFDVSLSTSRKVVTQIMALSQPI